MPILRSVGVLLHCANNRNLHFRLNSLLRGKAFVTTLEAKKKLDQVSVTINALAHNIPISSYHEFDASQAGTAQAYMALLALPYAIPVYSEIYVIATAITNVLQMVEVLSYTDGSSRGRWSYSWAGNEDVSMQERLDSTLSVCVYVVVLSPRRFLYYFPCYIYHSHLAYTQ
jgi:hypothetical protein